ncbi:unnamed protein product [Spirodela intermedia]|uniref:S-acyltransferase n=1 Tax=Spirodela intermedia TaxID=51605 RepID=A0A7I8JAZ8_SPIIN|nr:unnamed protein product [Spirodela intermedia]CAA6667388.1 unnamed protein product [Spirodela intermedia]
MRKHGWQLPYHPLQVVAIAVFLALGVAFYVFFAPFVGNKKLEHLAAGLYTPLLSCVFCIYVWCAATDPGDEGIFKSKKYLGVVDDEKPASSKGPRQGNESISSVNEMNTATFGEKSLNEASATDASVGISLNEFQKESISCFLALLGRCPLSYVCRQSHSCGQRTEQQMSEDGSFYCSLCEVEVYKYSKHCRVCDKCVDGFDHHCRWLNNCIGRRNYRGFFILMVSALLMLILQWSAGVFILIRCLLKQREFTGDITSKLGSSFSLPAFVVVVMLLFSGFVLFLAMVATLPLAQLFFLPCPPRKKGISTYDYIVALREQEQEQQGMRGQQSPLMSPVSSLTGLSSTSSFTNFRRGAWCTPPRLFLEDHQFDVALPEVGGSFRSVGKRPAAEQGRNPVAVKISPWTLARMNAEEVARTAAEARKRSRLLRPVTRRDVPVGPETDSSFARVTKATNKRGGRPPTGNTLHEALVKTSAGGASSGVAPLQLAARGAFCTNQPTSSHGGGAAAASPDSSRSSSVADEARKGIVHRSDDATDGYEASGGEDSDRIPAGTVHRLPIWNNLLFDSGRIDTSSLKGPADGRLD